MQAITPQLVSTIIPAYNRPETLQRAVDSVLAQTYRPIEIIIIDDASTDPAIAPLCAQLQTTHPDIIRTAQLPSNQGPGPAREQGRQLAQGEFIQYLDSDDTLQPEKFTHQVNALNNNPDCGAAYGWIRFHPINQPPNNTPHRWSGQQFNTLFPHLLAYRWWDTNCPLYRRSVLDQVGPWSNLRWSQDWEYDARVGALGIQLAYVPTWVVDEYQYAGERQSAAADWGTPTRARNRLQLISALYQHATTAGVTWHDKEMQHFARWAFRVCRLCGKAGLSAEAKAAYHIACQASGPHRPRDLRYYQWLARLVGWRLLGQWSSRWLDRGTRQPGTNTIMGVD